MRSAKPLNDLIAFAKSSMLFADPQIIFRLIMTFSSSVLQDARIAQVVGSFVRSCERFSSIDPEQLTYTPLMGGGSKAALYRFDIYQKTYVLRLLPEQANTFTRTHQVVLAKQAAQMGIGPEIYFVDEQKDGMIMHFISGRTAQKEDFECDDHLAQFAKVLQTLHHSKEEFPVACCPFKRFQQFILKGEEEKNRYPSRFSETKVLMTELEIVFKLNPVASVPTHLDLHPLNIMVADRQFFLVDWVNGGMCDPYFDLATFTTLLTLSKQQARSFLTHYFERVPTEFEWNRWMITQPVRPFVIAAALIHATTDALRSIAHTMLNIGLQITDQRNFKRALQYMQKK